MRKSQFLTDATDATDAAHVPDVALTASADLSLDTVKALAALCMGSEFSTFDETTMAVQVAPNTWIEITTAALAELTDRAMVTFSEDDPATGMPRVLTVTCYGRDVLRRWQAIHHCQFRVNPLTK